MFYVHSLKIVYLFNDKGFTISKMIKVVVSSKKVVLFAYGNSRLYGLAQNVSMLKYCSTLEIVFVHFREDFENFILELCFFTTKYALYLFLFLQVQSI